VLVRVGRAYPLLALPPGRVLAEQSRALDGRILEAEAAGEPWSLSDLVTILSAPLDGPVRVSAGAVVAARIRQLPRTPRRAVLPAQGTGEDAMLYTGMSAGAERSVVEAVRVPVSQRADCEGRGGTCDRLALPGETLCAHCRDGQDPVCSAGCGRTVTTPGTRCIPCQQTDTTPPPPTGCPGHDGRPCGRMPQAGGMCLRCRTAAEQRRAALDAQLAEVEVRMEAGAPPF
jgi:hypothetical protein